MSAAPSAPKSDRRNNVVKAPVRRNGEIMEPEQEHAAGAAKHSPW